MCCHQQLRPWNGAFTSRPQTLKETLQEVIPAKQEALKKLRAEHGSAVVGDIKVENIIGGMRGLKSMLWEASVLDPNEVRTCFSARAPTGGRC
jgi:hypothetical protein